MDTWSPSRRTFGAIGAAAGVIAGGVALGVAELLAGLRGSWRSPVLDVGDRVIDNVPSWVKDFAIETFGTNDKPALLIGIGVLVAIAAAIFGVVAFIGRLWTGLAGIAVFGVVGAVAALRSRTGTSLDVVVPATVGALAGMGALWLAWWVIARPYASTVPGQGASAYRNGSAPEGDGAPAERLTEAPTDSPRGTRRELLARTGGVLAVLAVAGGAAGAVGRVIRTRFTAAESRQAVRLAMAGQPAARVPGGVEVGVDGIAPFFTPNDDFYRIDTALTVPQLRAEDYQLRVIGMVDRELTFSFEELMAREVVEYDITLTCVSNTVGGNLVGNARWRGVRLDDLLAEAGVQRGADQVVGRSVDGYTCGFPLEAATDGRNALVAFGMNGEPLPLQHGFPVRLIVPGLYGYVSATKWLTEIEVTRFDEFEQYWVPRGYAEQAPIKLMSRIDSVDGLGTLTRDADGTVAIGGVAWAQTRGVEAVEVQLDDGDWQPADLGEALNDDTWRQWAFRWQPPATGRISIRCRAISADGEIQTAERAEPVPDGASGHHQIVVFVE
jgi:DMSO/TMAO reductase YedYZ molybdopterin-dependent catalytic subunit